MNLFVGYPWKFAVLKTSIFALESSRAKTLNVGDYQPIFPRQKHFIV